MSAKFTFICILLLCVVGKHSDLAVCQQAFSLQNSTEILLNANWLVSRFEKNKVGTRMESLGRNEINSVSDRFNTIKFVFSCIPESNNVYPSEQYFYFQFKLKERLISGNLRFCDSDKGIVNFGYFDFYDRSCSYHGSLSNDLVGVSIQKEGNVVKVELDGVLRSFQLIPPRLQIPPPLLENERIISPVLDESGFNFALIYSDVGPRFLFVLDEGAPLPEQLCPLNVGDLEFFIGFESRFIFLKNKNRLVLCGVLTDNITRNTYFDGPFDQVPPNLQIRTEIESVYPYVKARGGIDDHGNFIKQHGVRVAISPYFTYTDTSEFLNEVSKRSQIAREKGTTLLTELVYEWKTDFVPRSENGDLLSTPDLNHEKESNE